MNGIVQASLSTVPNSAIPYSYRKRVSPNGDEKLSAAGIAFVTPDGEALFVRRGEQGDHAGEWYFPGGIVEQNEEPHDAARREALEEVGRLPSWDLAPLHRETSDEGIDYVTFAQGVKGRFDPEINPENVEATWAPLTD